MKPILTLFILLLTPALQAQNRLFQGWITEQNTGRPLGDIEVSAPGAGSDRSDNNGVVQLQFASKMPGERIRLVIRDPNGSMLLVNQKEVENLRLARRLDEPFRIVMADRQRFFDAQQRYYGVLLEQSQQALARQEEELRILLRTTRSQEETDRLLEQIRKLEAEKYKLEAQAQERAMYLARIDLAQASELQRRALAYVEAGEVDSAIWVLSEEELEAAYANAAKGKQEALQSIRETIYSQELKASILVSRGQFAEAAGCWNYAYNMADESMPYEHLLIAKMLAKRGEMLIRAGSNASGMVSLDSASAHFYRAELVADSLNISLMAALVEAFQETEYLDEALHIQKVLIDSLEAYDEDATSQLAAARYNLGLLYSQNQRYEEAIAVLYALRAGWPPGEGFDFLMKVEQAEAHAHYLQGRGLLAREADCEHLRRANILVADRAEYIAAAGRCALISEEFGQAQSAFDQAGSLDSSYNHSEKLVDMGYWWLYQGEPDRAESHFEDYFEQHPTVVLKRLVEAQLLIHRRKKKEAIRILETLVEQETVAWGLFLQDPVVQEFMEKKAPASLKERLPSAE